MRKEVFLIIFVAFISGIAGTAFYHLFIQKEKDQMVILQYHESPNSERQNSRFSKLDSGHPFSINEVFRSASSIGKESVVFIKAQTHRQQQRHSDWFRLWDFFGDPGPSTSTGSGVIISSDGYILTNHHVIQNAFKIEVTLSKLKQSFEAEIIGTDPSTDLAVLKIQADNLPAAKFENSDRLEIGDWVLAIGNPFNLESTVTAGIVSARSRHLNIVRSQFPIESFIQTDAAINPGNSGGALVNLEGNIVGINTAIVTRTGTYAGYGFAIPSNIAGKVAEDLIEFGMVQRAFLEADVSELDASTVRKLKNETASGVIVDHVIPDGNADKAGLKKGDIIIQVNDRWISNRAFFDELIAYRRPGDEVELVVQRANRIQTFNVTLTNIEGTTELVKRTSIFSESLGAEFEPISRMERQKFNISEGIRVHNIQPGMLRRMNIPENFIITAFNNEAYTDASELIYAMENTRGRFVLEGIRPNGSRGVYSFMIR
jgi:serine protease Do